MGGNGKPEANDGSAPARRGRPGYDQATVLRRAIELFNQQGYDGTSMGDLARELGFSKSAIYHHVPSKEHLLAQALEEALAGLEAVVTAARDRDRPPYAGATAYGRLRTVLEASVAVLIAHQPAVTLLLRVRGNSEVELAALRRRRVIDTALSDLVREAVSEGSLRADLPADLVSRLLFGMVNSLAEWHRPGGAADGEQISRAVAAIAFEGLAGPGQ